MTPTERRAMELANHLHMRARINETIRDGAPVDYAQIREWAPMLREAADLLLAMSRSERHPIVRFEDDNSETDLRSL